MPPRKSLFDPIETDTAIIPGVVAETVIEQASRLTGLSLSKNTIWGSMYGRLVEQGRAALSRGHQVFARKYAAETRARLPLRFHATLDFQHAPQGHRKPNRCSSSLIDSGFSIGTDARLIG